MDVKYIEKNTDTVVEYYESITSTNDRAKEIAESLLGDRAILNDRFSENRSYANLIIAEDQTKGRGTNGRVWLSAKEKNILMTMLLYPEKNVKELEGITYKIAEMVRAAIKDLYGIELTIKLPNDLLLHGKKVSGILTESSVRDEKVNYLIIGIGFNVNQIEFPSELENIATSLKKEYIGNDYRREDIIIKIFNNVKSLI